MIYYEKKGHWPLLNSKNHKTTTPSIEEEYVLQARHFGVVGDREKGSARESVLEEGYPITPSMELRESRA